MGWSSWFSDGSGEKVSTKTESDGRGGSRTHFLRSTGGSKSNHSHTVVHNKSSGQKSAHHNPAKSRRK